MCLPGQGELGSNNWYLVKQLKVKDKLDSEVRLHGYISLSLSKDKEVFRVPVHNKVDQERYGMTAQLTQKGDVYSFGVVLLELLTRRKPVDHRMPRGQQSLVTWATRKWSETSSNNA